MTKISDMADQATTDAMNKILDTFGGIDGGISYMRMCELIKELGKRANNGDRGAATLVGYVHKFAALINVARSSS